MADNEKKGKPIFKKVVEKEQNQEVAEPKEKYDNKKLDIFAKKVDTNFVEQTEEESDNKEKSSLQKMRERVMAQKKLEQDLMSRQATKTQQKEKIISKLENITDEDLDDTEFNDKTVELELKLQELKNDLNSLTEKLDNVYALKYNNLEVFDKEKNYFTDEFLNLISNDESKSKEEQLEKVLQENESQKQDIEKMRNALEAANNKMEQLDLSLQEERAKLNDTAHEVPEELEKIKQELQVEKANSKKLLNQIKKLEEKSSDEKSKQIVDDLKMQLKDEKANSKKALNQIKKLEEKSKQVVDDLKMQLKDEKANSKKMFNQIKSLEEKSSDEKSKQVVDDLKKQLKEEKDNNKKITKELNNRIKELESKNNDEKIVSLNSQLVSLKEENTNLSSEIKTLEHRLNSDSNNKIIDGLKTKMSEDQIASKLIIKDLQDIIADLEKGKITDPLVKKLLQQKDDLLSEKENALNSVIQNKDEELSKLNDKLKTYNAVLKENEELQTKAKKVDLVVQENITLREKCDDLLTQLENQKPSDQDLLVAKLLEEKIKEIEEQSNEQLHQLTTENQSLKEKCLILSDEVHKLEDELGNRVEVKLDDVENTMTLLEKLFANAYKTNRIYGEDVIGAYTLSKLDEYVNYIEQVKKVLNYKNEYLNAIYHEKELQVEILSEHDKDVNNISKELTQLANAINADIPQIDAMDIEKVSYEVISNVDSAITKYLRSVNVVDDKLDTPNQDITISNYVYVKDEDSERVIDSFEEKKRKHFEEEQKNALEMRIQTLLEKFAQLLELQKKYHTVEKMMLGDFKTVRAYQTLCDDLKTAEAELENVKNIIKKTNADNELNVLKTELESLENRIDTLVIDIKSCESSQEVQDYIKLQSKISEAQEIIEKYNDKIDSLRNNK